MDLPVMEVRGGPTGWVSVTVETGHAIGLPVNYPCYAQHEQFYAIHTNRDILDSLIN